MNTPHFALYKDRAGEHRFRLHASNGQVLLSSTEEYYSKPSAKDLVIRNQILGILRFRAFDSQKLMAGGTDVSTVFLQRAFYLISVLSLILDRLIAFFHIVG